MTLPGKTQFLHPLDPLSAEEIRRSTKIIKEAFPDKDLSFNTIVLKEPGKNEFVSWSEGNLEKIARQVFFVVIESRIVGFIEGVVDLDAEKIIQHEARAGLMPLLTMEDLCNTELKIRSDKKVIEQCILSGVPADEMHNVYVDPWTIGYDERWGTSRRLQQALMYYRSNIDDSQYSHALDFCPIFDTETHEVVFIDVPEVRKPLSKAKHSNFNPQDINKTKDGYRTNSKPININQPEGVSFQMKGNVISWSNFKFHIGFNHREGIVLSDINYNDHSSIRPLFHRLSIAEMVVPYGNPNFPHHRKHAFDLGEYGAGLLTNPLTLGCDCKGTIHYLDAHFVNRDGEPVTVENAICIHEEDNGILFKHSDYRDDYRTCINTRATKLVVSQIFTAANYEYLIYWNFHQDGSIQLEVKLSGILNTYVLGDDESASPYGTRVYPGVNAHNHQHLFCLRAHPRIDGDGNSVATVDAVRSEDPVLSKNNYYGNGFYPQTTVFETVNDSITDYKGELGRTWDMFNPKKLNEYSGKPVAYRLISRECPPLLPKENGLVWKRAPFARHNVHVVPYKEDRLYPAGMHVPQSDGSLETHLKNNSLTKWIVEDGENPIEDSDVVLFHTFGCTHFPVPEDFPVMPCETVSLFLKPKHFFLQNPGLDIIPSHAFSTTQARDHKEKVIRSKTDTASTLAFPKDNKCCKAS